MRSRTHLLAVALAAGLGMPAVASGQAYVSVGGGFAYPTGDLGDAFASGYTVRAQMGVSLVLVDAHLQGGFTRFVLDDDYTGDAFTDDAWNVYHAGVGVRVGLGLVWLGANAAYFFGDGEDEWGYFPEVGVGLGPFELVADYRLGDPNWGALRAALKF